MHLPILDGSQGMCSNVTTTTTTASSSSSSARVDTLSSMKMVMNDGDDDDEQHVSRKMDSSSDGRRGKGNGMASALASWLAPSPPNAGEEQQPSQRATSIPNPAGASTSSTLPGEEEEEEDPQQRHRNTDNSSNVRRPSLPPSSRRPPSTSTLSALLEPFNPAPNSSNRDTDGRIRIPPTSRAGADIAEQKTAAGVGLLESWKYLPFLAHQGVYSMYSIAVSDDCHASPRHWGIMS